MPPGVHLHPRRAAAETAASDCQPTAQLALESRCPAVCAYTVKTTALGLVYGALYPPAYLLTALGLTLSYFCTRCGMRYWYARPSDINQEMMMKMRRRIGNVVGLSVFIQVCALNVERDPSLSLHPLSTPEAP